MNTLKAYKARFKVGLRIDVPEHWQDRCRGVARTVTRVLGSQYCYAHDGDTTRYWGVHPKASQMQFVDANTVRVRLDDKRFWTLVFPATVAP